MNHSTCKKVAVLLIVLILMLASFAQAQHLTVTGNLWPLALSSEADGEGETRMVSDIYILGMASDSSVAVLTEGEILYASAASISEMVPLAQLPVLADLGTLQSGQNSPEIASMQESLHALGYLEDAADGIFGGHTKVAVSDFQTEMGLNATGKADAITQQLIQQRAQKTALSVTYPPVFSVEDKFGTLAQNTSFDLQPFAGPLWNYSYDAYTKMGTLDAGTQMASMETGESSIDKVSMNASANVILYDENGQTMLTPILTIESLSTSRPSVQAVYVSQGYNTVSLTPIQSGFELSGIQVRETAQFALTPEALELLIKANESTVLHVECAGGAAYDLPLMIENLAFYTNACSQSGLMG